jgi:hypothetical protein
VQIEAMHPSREEEYGKPAYPNYPIRMSIFRNVLRVTTMYPISYEENDTSESRKYMKENNLAPEDRKIQSNAIDALESTPAPADEASRRNSMVFRRCKLD